MVLVFRFLTPSALAFFQRFQAKQQVHRISQQKQQIAVDNLTANFESGDQQLPSGLVESRKIFFAFINSGDSPQAL